MNKSKTKNEWIAIGGENDYGEFKFEVCESEQEAKEQVEEFINVDNCRQEECKVYEVVRELKRKVIWE